MAAVEDQPSLWEETAGDPPPTEPLEGTATADVAVIGAGYTGLIAAITLAEAGRSVVVLEAETPGWGASGRNGGQVNPGLKLGRASLSRRYGDARAGRIIAATEGAADRLFALIERHEIACEPARGGWAQLASTAPAAERLRTGAAEPDAVAGGMRLLDREETAARTGTDWYLNGLLDPRAGSLHPLLLAHGLIRAAQGAGVHVHRESPALSIDGSEGAFTVVTPGGRVRAGRVVVATNAYAGPLLPRLRRSVAPVVSTQVATMPLPDNLRPMPDRLTATDVRRVTLYFRTDAQRRFVIGGRGASDPARNQRLQAGLRAMAATLFPGLADPDLWRHAWAGKVAMTADHLPKLVEPMPGVVAGFGYNGRGVALSSVVGDQLAARTLGADAEALDLPLEPVRPIPFHQLHGLGVAGTITLYRLRDAWDARRHALRRG